MIKKSIAVLLALVMLLSLIGCSNYSTSTESSNSDLSSVTSNIYDSSTNSSNGNSSDVSEPLLNDFYDSEITHSSSDQSSSLNSSSNITDSDITIDSDISEEYEPMVWIPTNGGKKYHSKSSCSNMKTPTKVTKSYAIESGFGPCGRCY